MPELSPQDWAASILAQALGPNAGIVEIAELQGQASARRYFRLRLAKARFSTALVVQLPPAPFASDEAAQSEAASELPFCSILKFLQQQGLRVPELLYDGTQSGFLLIEDLGAETLLSVLQRSERQEWIGWYEDAVGLLARFQKATWPPRHLDSIRPCVAYGREFDAGLLRWELQHFEEWGLEAACGVSLPETQAERLHGLFDRLVADLQTVPRLLVHRDFQSTNLIPCSDGLGLIDFQDALIGPAPYDLVALLRDSYVQLTDSEVRHLVSCYLKQAPHCLAMDSEQCQEAFDKQTVQRKLKDAGRFVYIDRVKHNPRYLEYYEPSLHYVKSALGRLPAYGDITEILSGYIDVFK